MKTGPLTEALQLLTPDERQLWCEIVTAMTRAELCKHSANAVRWGDDVVLAYRERMVTFMQRITAPPPSFPPDFRNRG